MKYSCIPNGNKMRKMISPLSPVAIPFLSTRVISFLNQSAFSIFARFSMVRARGALSRFELIWTRAKRKKHMLSCRSEELHSNSKSRFAAELMFW